MENKYLLLKPLITIIYNISNCSRDKTIKQKIISEAKPDIGCNNMCILYFTIAQRQA